MTRRWRAAGGRGGPNPAVEALGELADPRAWRFAERPASRGVRSGPSPDAPRIARRDGGSLSVGDFNGALRNRLLTRTRYVDPIHGRVFVYTLVAASTPMGRTPT